MGKTWGMRMQKVRRRLVLNAAVALAVMATALTSAVEAVAQTWPSRPVKVIVPVAAGTATDLTARIFAEKLSPRWGQPIVVENRPGADGLIAIGSFVSARDDHALLFSFSTAVSLNPLVHAKLPYDPNVDLTPITTTTEVLFGIAVHAAVPATSVKELGAYAGANPGKLNWAAAPGLPRFVLERYRREQKLDMVYVSYNQTGTAVQDLGEGRIQAMIGSVSTLLPVLEAKKANLIVIASTDRSVLAPGVASAIEAGFPDLAVPAVGCVYGWKDMPADLRDRVARDVDAVAQDAGIADRLAKIGQVVRRSTPQDLGKLLAEQRLRLAPLAASMTAQ
jgi:tripartite-type tricarboxylate transporter receptor subunit TctC